MSLSVSAPHGKWFASGGKRYGHVIDPRTGYPTSRNLLAAIVMPSPTDGDALSTGLLTLGHDFLEKLEAFSPDIRALVAEENDAGEMRSVFAGCCSFVVKMWHNFAVFSSIIKEEFVVRWSGLRRSAKMYESSMSGYGRQYVSGRAYDVCAQGLRAVFRVHFDVRHYRIFEYTAGNYTSGLRYELAGVGLDVPDGVYLPVYEKDTRFERVHVVCVQRIGRRAVRPTVLYLQ